MEFILFALRVCDFQPIYPHRSAVDIPVAFFKLRESRDLGKDEL